MTKKISWVGKRPKRRTGRLDFRADYWANQKITKPTKVDFKKSFADNQSLWDNMIKKEQYNKTRCISCRTKLSKWRVKNRCKKCEKAYNEGYERCQEKIKRFANGEELCL